MNISLQLAISLGTMLGSALAAFFGVRISVARLEERLRAQEYQMAQLVERVERLEAPHFAKGR